MPSSNSDSHNNNDADFADFCSGSSCGNALLWANALALLLTAASAWLATDRAADNRSVSRSCLLKLRAAAATVASQSRCSSSSWFFSAAAAISSTWSSRSYHASSFSSLASS